MSETPEFVIHTDGGARGNPGPAAYAFVIRRPGQEDFEENGLLGKTTNNIAEYSALVRALERARELGGKRLRIHSDSELLVQQMKGIYKVKNEGLKPLFEQARSLARTFENVTFQHVRRELNQRADALCNEALDGGELRNLHLLARPSAPPPSSKVKQIPGQDLKVKEKALHYLQSCARAWAQGDPENPPVREVWERLLAILADGEGNSQAS